MKNLVQLLYSDSLESDSISQYFPCPRKRPPCFHNKEPLQYLSCEEFSSDFQLSSPDQIQFLLYILNIIYRFLRSFHQRVFKSDDWKEAKKTIDSAMWLKVIYTKSCIFCFTMRTLIFLYVWKAIVLEYGLNSSLEIIANGDVSKIKSNWRI